MDCHKKLMSSANWVYQADQARPWQSEAERQVEGVQVRLDVRWISPNPRTYEVCLDF